MNLEGQIIWFTGISGAGKSTLANAVQQKLQGSLKNHVMLLDGDLVREFFEGDLGYSRQDRIANIRRITFAAHLLSQAGVTVLVANIAPYREVRDFVRKKLGDRYHQVYVQASLERVTKNDVKGLYSSQQSVGPLIGVEDAYEPPRNPSLVIPTDSLSVDESVAMVIAYLESVR